MSLEDLNHCNHPKRLYNAQYDAYYCKECLQWLEKGCNDPRCEFCPKRPEKAPKDKK